MLLAKSATAPLPSAIDCSPVAAEDVPTAVDCTPAASGVSVGPSMLLALPIATAPSALAVAERPIAVEKAPLASELGPQATEPLPVAEPATVLVPFTSHASCAAAGERLIT